MNKWKIAWSQEQPYKRAADMGRLERLTRRALKRGNARAARRTMRHQLARLA